MNFRDIERRVMDSQPEHPPSASEGGVNAFHFSCETAGYSPGYCVCLAKINAYERDGELKCSPACDRAISFGETACPAIGMRAKEREAGKALYFLDRVAFQKACDEIWAAERAEMNPRPTPATRKLPSPYHSSKERKSNPAPAYQPKPAPAPAPKPAGHVMPTYADAINAALRESKPKASGFVPKLPTESMAEYAARVRAAQ